MAGDAGRCPRGGVDRVAARGHWHQPDDGITLEPASKDMLAEAAGAGFYHSPGWNRDYPRLQILTIADLFNGQEVKMPMTATTFKQAGKEQGAGGGEQGTLFG